MGSAEEGALLELGIEFDDGKPPHKFVDKLGGIFWRRRPRRHSEDDDMWTSTILSPKSLSPMRGRKQANPLFNDRGISSPIPCNLRAGCAFVSAQLRQDGFKAEASSSIVATPSSIRTLPAPRRVEHGACAFTPLAPEDAAGLIQGIDFIAAQFPAPPTTRHPAVAGSQDPLPVMGRVRRNESVGLNLMMRWSAPAQLHAQHQRRWEEGGHRHSLPNLGSRDILLSNRWSCRERGQNLPKVASSGNLGDLQNLIGSST